MRHYVRPANAACLRQAWFSGAIESASHRAVQPCAVSLEQVLCSFCPHIRVPPKGALNGSAVLLCPLPAWRAGRGQRCANRPHPWCHTCVCGVQVWR